MVKKIRGSKPGGKASSATPVQATKTVQSAKVGEVDKVQASEKRAPSGKTTAATASYGCADDSDTCAPPGEYGGLLPGSLRIRVP